jgi:hypothetical protein
MLWKHGAIKQRIRSFLGINQTLTFSEGIRRKVRETILANLKAIEISL